MCFTGVSVVLRLLSKSSSDGTTCLVLVLGTKPFYIHDRRIQASLFVWELTNLQKTQVNSIRSVLLHGHWYLSQGEEILTTPAVIQRGTVCEQAHKEESQLKFTMRLCEQERFLFDQILSHLPPECDLVSTVTALSCDIANLSFSSWFRGSVENTDAKKSGWCFCILTLLEELNVSFYVEGTRWQSSWSGWIQQAENKIFVIFKKFLNCAAEIPWLPSFPSPLQSLLRGMVQTGPWGDSESPGQYSCTVLLVLNAEIWTKWRCFKYKVVSPSELHSYHGRVSLLVATLQKNVLPVVHLQI